MRAVRADRGARVRLYASTTDTYDPDSDVDLVVVERLMNGLPVENVEPAERVCAARLLHGRGFTLSAIAARVGRDHATVKRWRENGWKPSAGNRRDREERAAA